MSMSVWKNNLFSLEISAIKLEKIPESALTYRSLKSGRDKKILINLVE